MTNIAQIDEMLEKLMRELQGFKRSSDLLTDAGTKSEEIIAAAEAVLKLCEQIREDNQRQVEAVQKYTTTSEQNLTALVASITEAQTQQKEALKATTQTFQQEIAVLAKSVKSVREEQDEATAMLARSILSLTEEQKRAHDRHMWLILFILAITLIGTGVSLWMLVAPTGGT